MSSDVKKLFLNEKPVMTLVTIRRAHSEIYGSIISRRIDTTYAHAVKIISQLEEEGLVESEKQGRKKILSLTEEGQQFADIFLDMLNMFEECGEEETSGLSMEGSGSKLSDNII